MLGIGLWEWEAEGRVEEEPGGGRDRWSLCGEWQLFLSTTVWLTPVSVTEVTMFVLNAHKMLFTYVLLLSTVQY